MSVKTLSRITEVKTERHESNANTWLNQGWLLLSVASVTVQDGSDAYVETKYVLGFPGQDPVDDA
ncbi:hypothetical protein [Xanthomonas campestris]|uniref:hypothetical protein n=1 Tax=Xanthomonas campestris TaxID=339 RepID=UPI0012904110|nr:hypothetical protein [Xanthomonas campestris]